MQSQHQHQQQQQQQQDLMNLTKPSTFLTQLGTLDEKLPSVLDDFRKYFVFYSKNPEYAEYQQAFENIKGNLRKLSAELFMVTNNIEKGTDDINHKLLKLDELIEKEKMKNKVLRKKLGLVETKYDGSAEMISNYKDTYNLYYLKNFGVFLGIVVSLVAVKKVSNTYY
jgi:hypothetical protein